MNAYNIFFYIYRRRIYASIADHKHNINNNVLKTDLHPPSSIITQEDINKYFGPPGDCYHDEIIHTDPRDLQYKLSFESLAQAVAAAWRAIDASSKHYLKQRAKLYLHHYRKKNKQWKAMKEERGTVLTNVAILRNRFYANAARPSSDNTIISSSTVTKAKYALRSQKNCNMVSMKKGKCIVESSSSNEKQDKSIDNVLQFSAAPLDFSTSDLFDEGKIDSECDDALSFQSEATNNTNITFHDATTKFPPAIHRCVAAGSGHMDPTANMHHKDDAETTNIIGTTLRYVTPEPVQHQGKDIFTTVASSEINVDNCPHDIFAKDFPQKFRSFIPSKHKKPPSMPQQLHQKQQMFGVNVHQRERRLPYPFQTSRNVDHYGAFHGNRKYCYPPQEEARQLYYGVPNRIDCSDYMGQQIPTTHESMNQYVRHSKIARRSQGAGFHAMMEQPPSVKSHTKHAHGYYPDTYSRYSVPGFDPSGRNDSSSHRYHSFPIQNPVSQSLLPSSLVRTKNAMMDDAYSMHQNQHQQFNDSPNESYNCADFGSIVTPNARQSPFSFCNEMFRNDERLRFDHPNPLYASSIEQSSMWPALSRQAPYERTALPRQIPYEGTIRSNSNDDDCMDRY